MKILRIEKEEGKEGLGFFRLPDSCLYEMKLEGRIVFIVEERSELQKNIEKLKQEHDLENFLPALRGAAFRILEETDFKVSRISDLRAVPTIAEGTHLKIAVDPRLLVKGKKEKNQ